MICNDPSITYLKSFGYNVVRLPKVGIEPLQLITKNGSAFELLGELSTILAAGTHIDFPQIKKDQVTASISGQRTSDLSIDVGITILGNIVGAMGGSKIGLQEQYSNARTMAFEFEDVLTDSVEVAAIDQYLTDAGVNPYSTHIKTMLEAGEIYMITAVIKSDKINVAATAKDKNSFSVDVPVIKDIVGGNVKIEGSADKSSKLTFSGSTPLVFGFKAVKLSYDNGVYTAFKPLSEGGGALSTSASDNNDNWNWLPPEDALLNLNEPTSTEQQIMSTANIDDQKPQGDDEKDGFDAKKLDKTVIAIPLLHKIKEAPDKDYDVIIDLHLDYLEGRAKAKEKVSELFKQLSKSGYAQIDEVKSRLSYQYLFAKINGTLVSKLVLLDKEDKKPAIYKVWLDFEVQAFISKSLSTVKADAARQSFSAMGEDINWAVVDSGIDFEHSHFQLHANKHPYFNYHLDLSGATSRDPFADDFGHGTHVAGIIAGEGVAPPQTAADAALLTDGQTSATKEGLYAITKVRDEQGGVSFEVTPITKISGMAPKCKLISIKVLNAEGTGLASSLIAAIEHIQDINGYGRDIKIHGVNLSLGYAFDPEWFACGQSPLCVEVDRLVKSGVVVVAAAGNTGYGFVSTAFNGRAASGMSLSINDPGNADLAITVGSTHRDMPHTYGVSYFSSKGPTGDGRLKPDLVAPGEKIISCAAGNKKNKASNQVPGHGAAEYIEDSGTSMAAPHVSGVIAAFLSIRKEYIGKPETVKEIFMNTATDLKRDHYFQGKGLIDLMRAIQSI